jgi:hemimethylated DNA binding protein
VGKACARHPPPPPLPLARSAVIIAADASCRASPDWVVATGSARLARGTSQPFYTCLVDIRDRPAAQVSYVAEENVELLLAPSAEGSTAVPVVLHPLIAKHFVAYERGLFLAEGAGGGDDDESRAKFPKSMAA